MNGVRPASARSSPICIADNDKVLADFLAFKGKSVLITSDKNKTARSLQFGDNSGKFQHGATQVIHADMPQNNADTARMSRLRGSRWFKACAGARSSSAWPGWTGNAAGSAECAAVRACLPSARSSSAAAAITSRASSRRADG